MKLNRRRRASVVCASAALCSGVMYAPAVFMLAFVFVGGRAAPLCDLFAEVSAGGAEGGRLFVEREGGNLWDEDREGGNDEDRDGGNASDTDGCGLFEDDNDGGNADTRSSSREASTDTEAMDAGEGDAWDANAAAMRVRFTTRPKNEKGATHKAR